MSEIIERVWSMFCLWKLHESCKDYPRSLRETLGGCDCPCHDGEEMLEAILAAADAVVAQDGGYR